jgi:hypothetical protein
VFAVVVVADIGFIVVREFCCVPFLGQVKRSVGMRFVVIHLFR